MKALSLFANVGVAETYLSEIGVDVVVANELEEDRARFYQHLYPKCNMICGDITDKEIYNSKQCRDTCIFAQMYPPRKSCAAMGRQSEIGDILYVFRSCRHSA